MCASGRRLAEKFVSDVTEHIEHTVAGLADTEQAQLSHLATILVERYASHRGVDLTVPEDNSPGNP